MTDNPLFRDRVPEAAAIQLAVVLAYAAECALATVESMEMLKRPPKGELARAREIAEKLAWHCADLSVPPRGFLGDACPRLAVRIAALRETDARLKPNHD